MKMVKMKKKKKLQTLFNIWQKHEFIKKYDKALLAYSNRWIS